MGGGRPAMMRRRINFVKIAHLRYSEGSLLSMFIIFLWQAEIRLVSGLHLSDITYFRVFVSHIRQCSLYRAFVNLTEDQDPRNWFRNQYFRKTSLGVFGIYLFRKYYVGVIFR